MKYNSDRHHRRSIRLRGWDYRSVGAYFVTICTFDRECILLNPSIAKAVRLSWRSANGGWEAPVDEGRGNIEGQCECEGAAPPPTAGSLSAFVCSFKSLSTKRINALRETPRRPVWQRNYYERILRDERELTAARQYILDNPSKWASDPNNPATAPRL